MTQTGPPEPGGAGITGLVATGHDKDIAIPKNLRRVIFLDIDGVLNRFRTHRFVHVEEELVLRLKTILEETDSHIVFSTFWRCFPDYLSYVLSRYGIPGTRVVGTTPVRT